MTTAFPTPMMQVTLSMLLMAGAESMESCVLPPTRHLNFSDSCAAHSDIASTEISWAAQRGEYESMQLLISSQIPGTLSLEFSDLIAPSGAILHKSVMTWKQQGYVYARHTSRYADSGCPGKIDCWRPDPLLDPFEDNTIMLEATTHQPLWITIRVPQNVAAAAQGSEYVGSVTITIEPTNPTAEVVQSTTIPISLEVWHVTAPSTADATVQHIWGFSANKVLPFYPDDDPSKISLQWWDFMEAHRIPPLETAFNPLAPTSYLDGKTRVLHSNLQYTDCNCSSCPVWAAEDNARKMKPIVDAAQQVKGAKYFAYGFDERPKSCEKSIRTSFKAFLDTYPVNKYPQVAGTMAALNWAGADGMPLDMPYTGWVLQYQYYNKTEATRWVNSMYEGRHRELYLYHCIEPSGVDYLNIFLERPLIQARLLFWLGSVQNIQGWLYWTTDLWANCPSSPDKYAWQHKNRSVMRRINNTMLTDFEPGSVIWCDEKLFDFWVNGDGYYMYPGPDGPITTARLETIRDALEDMELFRMLPIDAAAKAVQNLVRSPTDHEDNPMLLERIRRELGRQASLYQREGIFV